MKGMVKEKEMGGEEAGEREQSMWVGICVCV